MTSYYLYIYIYESSTLVKAYGIKVWCYWEHLGELDGNTLETAKSGTPPNPKEKKTWAILSAC
jgi:hypothetical protein